MAWICSLPSAVQPGEYLRLAEILSGDLATVGPDLRRQRFQPRGGGSGLPG